MVDYSRFDRIGDSEDDEPLSQPTAVAPLPAAQPHSAPPDVMDDLNDYFERMEQRRHDNDNAAPPSVDRFSEADVRAFSTTTFDPSSSYEECSVCLSDFVAGEPLTVLPCAAKHVLHPRCAIDCLTRSAHCPLCRVDLAAIAPPSGAPQERPLTPRMLGYTRDGGVVQRYEPHPPAEMQRPAYVPANLRDQASYVEVAYPEQGIARIWRVPRDTASRSMRGEHAPAQSD